MGMFSFLRLFVTVILLLQKSVDSHWINLHVWYDDILDQQEAAATQSNNSLGPPIVSSALLVSNNVTNHYNQMQQDGHGGTPISSAPVPLTPESLYFHQPRPLPPCDQLTGLTKAQIDICKVFNDHMRSIIHGAKLGLSECRFQFRYHHWNCSSPPSSNDFYDKAAPPPLITLTPTPTRKRRTNEEAALESETKWNSVLKHGSKEVAFAHSVWSAAVAQAIARACRDGSLTSCGCGKTPRPSELKDEWRWGGCGDNLQYGYKFAADFVDSREREKQIDKRSIAKSLVNLHNNEAGRRAVLKKTKIACKCHGVSGSCALVTCWHQIPSFRDIGDHLKERHTRATLVKMNRRGRLQVKRSSDKVPSVYDLVYMENSPNYCVRNESLGVPGPTGRICSRSSTGPDSCKSLCCNKGWTTSVIKKNSRCNCKFVWCCQVICEECKKVQKISACK